MAKENKNNPFRSDDIKRRRDDEDREPILEDPTCIDAASALADDDDDDEGTDIDWDLAVPELIVYSEVVRCRKNKSWVNLTIQYLAVDDFEYEFTIEEVEN